MSRTALVTGGCGFIGLHLSAHLERTGWTALLLDRPSPDCRPRLDALGVKAALIEGDIADERIWTSLAGSGIDTVFHLAGQADVARSSREPVEDFRINVGGTLNALEFARREKIRKVVFPSSASVLAPGSPMPLKESTPMRASSPYGAAKAAGENYCYAYAHAYKMNVTVLRLFNVFGPMMTRFVIHDLTRKLQNDPTQLTILGDGNQVRDYLYIDDAVRGFVLAAERGEAGAVYNMASGIPVRIRDLAQQIIAALGLRDVKIHYTMETWPGDVREWYADTTLFASLGFRAEVPWEEGLRRTLESFGVNPT
ncbi:MAG: NAD-dependent epimerase/dehydratase family protein [Gemmatimonadales bacterium]